jgi:isopenicillin N synthase-like dioxygenase
MTTPLVEEHGTVMTALPPPPDAMAPTAFIIPTISLSENPRQDIVSALRDASLSSGFFQLVDIHSYISNALVTQMFEQTALFFALPASEKEKVSWSTTILYLESVFVLGDKEESSRRWLRGF